MNDPIVMRWVAKAMIARHQWRQAADLRAWRVALSWRRAAVFLLLVGQASAQVYFPSQKECWIPPLGGGSSFDPNDPRVFVEGENSDPIHLSSGEFYREETDLSVRGRGIDFAWTRSYATRNGPKGSDASMGNGWDHCYNIWIEEVGFDDLIVHDGHCRSDTYEYELDKDFKWTSRGFYDEIALDFVTGEYVRTFPDGSTQRFFEISESSDASGKLKSVSDPNANTMYFGYDTGKLVTISDTLLRTYTISYTGNRITSVADFAGRTVSYAYYGATDPDGAAGDLKSVTSPAVTGTVTGNNFPAGKVTTYKYTRGHTNDELNHALLAIVNPKGFEFLRNTLEAAMDDDGVAYMRVSRQFMGTGDYKYVYVEDLDGTELNGATEKTIINDRMGNVEEVFFDHSNHLVMRREFTGRANPALPTTDTTNRPAAKLRATDPDYFETTYGYNSDHRLAWAEQLQTGVREEWEYEDGWSGGSVTNVRERKNLLTHTRLPGSILGPVSDQVTIVESYTYEPAHNRVLTYTGPRGEATTYHHDSAGNVTRIDYPAVTLGVLGGGTQLGWEIIEYNTFGQMTVHRWASNRRDEFVYYSSAPHYGYLQAHIVDALGAARETEYTYTVLGDVASETDPAGSVTNYAYNQLRQLVQTLHPAAQPGHARGEERRKYDENDNIVQVDVRNIDATGAVLSNEWWTETREYDGIDRLVETGREASPGHVAELAYDHDENGNLILTEYGEATAGNDPTNVESTIYDERDLPFRVTRGAGGPTASTTEFAYDGRTYLVDSTEGMELGASLRRATHFVIDGYGRSVKRTDAEGNELHTHFDAAGNRVSEELWGEPVEGSSGSSAGNILLRREEYSYDERNRQYETRRKHKELLTGVTIGDGWRTQRAYWTVADLPQATADDNGHGEFKAYTTAGDLQLELDSGGNSRQYTYDSVGRLGTVVHTDVHDSGATPTVSSSVYVHDARGNLLTLTTAGTLYGSYGYDVRGEQVKCVDGRGNETQYTIDGLGRCTTTTRPLHAGGTGAGAVIGTVTTEVVWDDASRVSARIDDNGNVTAYFYDGLGHETSVEYADGTTESRAYDALGNVVSSTDANGSVTSFTHDLLGRVRTKEVVRATGVIGTTWENFEYDGASNVRWARDDDSVVECRYDSLGKVIADRIAIDGGVPVEVGLTWDGAGNVTQVRYPSGRVINQAYDELNRKSTITEGSTTLASYWYTGPFKLVEGLQLANGTATATSYDVLGRVSGITHQVGTPTSGTPFVSMAYQWDSATNKTRRTDSLSGAVHDYAYDSLNRMTQSVRSGTSANRTISYSLDGVGNRVSVAGGPPPSVFVMDATLPDPGDYQLNQYTQSTVDPEFDEGAKAQTYDANGNLTKLTEIAPAVGLVKKVWYDYRNQMVEVQLQAAAPKHRYCYDAFGRLVAIIKNATTTPVPTRFYYARYHVIEERDGAGATSATYVLGAHVDERIQMQRVGVNYYYHADDLGNVLRLTDASGAVVEAFDYSDYGRILNPTTWQVITPGGVGNPYYWQGHRYESLSKWYAMRSRYYMPGKGRFTTRDTVGIWGDEGNLGNGYAFCGNNSWSRTDPRGEGWLGAIIGGAIGAVVGACSAEGGFWDKATGAVSGAAAGAVIGSGAEGALIGGAVGAVAGGVAAAVTGGDISDGLTSGATAGAIAGAAISTLGASTATGAFSGLLGNAAGSTVQSGPGVDDLIAGETTGGQGLGVVVGLAASAGGGALVGKVGGALTSADGSVSNGTKVMIAVVSGATDVESSTVGQGAAAVGGAIDGLKAERDRQNELTKDLTGVGPDGTDSDPSDTGGSGDCESDN